MSGSEQVFATKVDAWLAAVMVTSLVGSLVAVAVAARETPRDAAIAGAVVLASFALVAAVAIPTRYTIAERELEIRSGMLRYQADRLSGAIETGDHGDPGGEAAERVAQGARIAAGAKFAGRLLVGHRPRL